MATEYTQVPNWIFDLMPALSGLEFAVLMDLCRQTYGWHRETDASSAAEVARRIGSGRVSVARAQAALVAEGLIIAEAGERGRIVRRVGAPREVYQEDTAPVSRGYSTNDAPVSRGYSTCIKRIQHPVSRGYRPDDDLAHQDATNEGIQIKGKKIKENTTTTPISTDRASVAAPAAPAGGGGEPIGRTPTPATAQPANPETLELLRQANVISATAYQHLEPRIVREAIKLAGRHQRAQSPGGLVASLLRRYVAGDDAWLPPPPAPARPAAPSMPPREACLSPAEMAARTAAAREQFRALRLGGQAVTA